MQAEQSMCGFDFPGEENRRLAMTRRGTSGYFLGAMIGGNWGSARSIPIIFVVVIIQIQRETIRRSTAHIRVSR